MLGFSRKRIIISFILSIFILIITGVIQGFDSEEWNFVFLGPSCSVTGYPVATCLTNAGNGLLFSINLANFFFWFVAINSLYSIRQIRVGVLALVIWAISIIIQKQYGLAHCISGNLSWYKITGFPIAECVSRDEKLIVFTVYLTNIAFWFLTIKLIQKAFVIIKSKVS